MLRGLHDSEKVKLLLDAGAKIPDAAIFVAVTIPGASRTVRLLAEKGTNLNVADGGYTPLMAAARGGDLDTIRFLIDQGADVRARTKSGYTALYGAASWPGNGAAIVRLLLEKGADPNVRVEIPKPAEEVFTPAMGAAMRGDAETLKQLVDAGADVTVQGGRFARTALLMAATTAREEAVRILLAKGANVKVKDHLSNTPLQWAKRRGDTTIVKLVEKASGGDARAANAVEALPRLNEELGADSVRRAIGKSLPLLQQGAETFTSRKGCVSCHHQSLVAMTVGLARRHGFEVDEQAASRERTAVLGTLEGDREKILISHTPRMGDASMSYFTSKILAVSPRTEDAWDALACVFEDQNWATERIRLQQNALVEELRERGVGRTLALALIEELVARRVFRAGGSELTRSRWFEGHRLGRVHQMNVGSRDLRRNHVGSWLSGRRPRWTSSREQRSGRRPATAPCLASTHTYQPDINLSLDELPFLGSAKLGHHVIEGFGVGLGEIEQGQKVERFAVAEVAAVMQATGDTRQILEPNGDMLRLFLKEGPPFVLSQRPPLRVLADRDQSHLRGLRATERGLLLDQSVLLVSGDVTVVAGDAAEHPLPPFGQGRDGTGDNVQALDRRQGVADDRLDRDDRPLPHFAPDKGE